MTTSDAPPVEVELATWRPARVVDVEGWAVGLSGGFTRRANSVAATVDVPDVERALDVAEHLYADAGLPPVVRVCEATRPTGLDDVLEERGYAVAARTLLMVRTEVPARAGREGTGEAEEPGAGAAAGAPAPLVRVADEPDDAWLRGWLEVKASGAVDLDLARTIVRGAPASYLTASDADGDVGVVRVAVRDGWAAVSCLMVAERARRRGLASHLTAAATRHAARAGAARSFVQVEASNAGARALYERLGFATAAAYHYRERR